MDIRYRYLDDAEADRLYATHPELGHSPDTYCPTCEKKGDYIWQGKLWPCDCVEQLQLHKHYLAAGIGMTYQRLTWADLENAENAREVCEWGENPSHVKRGSGLILFGEMGTGKTMMAMLCLKQFVKDGYSCFATTFAEMVEMYTAGWYSPQERDYFHHRVVESQVLLLDDVGRGHKSKNRLDETTFDTVMRARVQHGRSTIITTNMTPADLGQGYGASVLRLLREKSDALEIGGEDFSEKAKRRGDDEVASGETRPIT